MTRLIDELTDAATGLGAIAAVAFVGTSVGVGPTVIVGIAGYRQRKRVSSTGGSA